MKFFEHNLLDLGAVTDWPVINVKRDLCQENGRANRANEVQGERKKYDIDGATTKSNGHKGRYDRWAHNCSGSICKSIRSGKANNHNEARGRGSAPNLHPCQP